MIMYDVWKSSHHVALYIYCGWLQIVCSVGESWSMCGPSSSRRRMPAVLVFTENFFKGILKCSSCKDFKKSIVVIHFLRRWSVSYNTLFDFHATSNSGFVCHAYAHTHTKNCIVHLPFGVGSVLDGSHPVNAMSLWMHIHVHKRELNDSVQYSGVVVILLILPSWR